MEKETPKTEVKKSTKKRTVPQTDIDLGAVVTKATEKWKANPWLTLQWVKVDQFESDAINYNIILEARLTDGGSRPQIGKALKVLDKKIDDSLSYVKGYIAEKYKKESATSYFPAFGIEMKDGRYAFPRDQNKRLASLKLMVNGLEKNGFESREYGKKFWETILKDYEKLMKVANDLDGAISVNVGGKNVLKANVVKGLNALVNVIKGNFPETYKQELRDWGFQKEKY
mgnify:FL=1